MINPKNFKQRGDRGFIKMVLLVVVVLLIISYFGINLRSVVDSPTTKDNFAVVASTTAWIWHDYLKAPASYIWNKIFVDLIWDPAIDNITDVNADASSNR